jgi:hypothetical protein
MEEGLILCNLVSGPEMKMKGVPQFVAAGGDQEDPRASLLKLREPSKYMVQYSTLTGVGEACSSVHSATSQ